MHILALPGALRRESFNRKLLKVAVGLLPDGVTAEIFELHDVPLYNGDVEDAGFPPSVVELRDKIQAADGVLIATPEYNYSIPGVLKNALDWASRPPAPPFDGKPVAIMGASTGLYGTVRMQSHLRQVFHQLNARIMQKPEYMLAQAQNKFDAEWRLTDPKSLELLGKFVNSFISGIKQRK